MGAGGDCDGRRVRCRLCLSLAGLSDHKHTRTRHTNKHTPSDLAAADKLEQRKLAERAHKEAAKAERTKHKEDKEEERRATSAAARLGRAFFHPDSKRTHKEERVRASSDVDQLEGGKGGRIRGGVSVRAKGKNHRNRRSNDLSPLPHRPLQTTTHSTPPRSLPPTHFHPSAERRRRATRRPTTTRARP